MNCNIITFSGRNEISQLPVVPLELFEGARLASALQPDDDTFAHFDGLVGEDDGVRHLGRYAQVLEEALMRRPELAPHRFAHAILGVDQFGRLVELLHRLHPQLDACVVHLFEVLRQRYLFDFEGDAVEAQLSSYVHSWNVTKLIGCLVYLLINERTSELHVHGDDFHGTDPSLLHSRYEVGELAEGGALTPHAQPHHVRHVPGLGGSGGRGVNDPRLGQLVL